MPAQASGPPHVVAALLTPVVESAGLVLEDVSVTAAGRRRVVRVVVDAADGTDEDADLDLDAVAAVSQAVSDALDGSDVLGEAEYVLEVTSPGVDRPLTAPRHWARARGRLVRAVLVDGTDLLLRVGAVDDEGVHGVLDPQPVKGKPPRKADVGAPRDLAWEQLVRGEVQVEFRRAELDALEARGGGEHDEGPDDTHDDDTHDGREDER